MPKFKRFSGDVPILIELDGDGEQLPGGSLEDAFEVVGAIAASSINAIRKFTGKQQPQEIEISFGLRAVEDQASLTVTLGDDRVNFRVKVKWGGAPLGELMGQIVR